MSSESRWRPWGCLVDSIRTGEAAFTQVFGMSDWEYATTNPGFLGPTRSTANCEVGMPRLCAAGLADQQDWIAAWRIADLVIRCDVCEVIPVERAR